MSHLQIATLVPLLFVPACFDGPSRGSNPTPPPPIITNDGGVPGGCGGAGDLDGDCVPNAQDQCSRTAAGAAVWKQGAWAGCGNGQFKDIDDGDRDNVPNSQDQCPGTAAGQPVDARGCAAGQQPGGKQDGAAPPPKYDSGVKPTYDSKAPPKPDQGTPGVTLTAAEQDLVQAINKERLSVGVGAVSVDAKLMCTARLAAKSGTCGHYAGGSWIDRGKKCGLNNTEAWLINEIATGQGFTDGAMAVWGWKSSSGHYWGLKHPQAKKIGVAKSSAGCYWAIFDCCIKGS